MIKVSTAFRKDSLSKDSTIFRLYVRNKGKKKFKCLTSRATLEECKHDFQECMKWSSNSNLSWLHVEDDYIIKKVVMSYQEETIDMSPLRKLKEKLPELEGLI